MEYTATYRIRPANAKDIQEIEEIAQEAYAIYIPRMNKKPYPMLADYKELIQRDTVHVLIASNKIQGFIVLIEQNDGYLLLDNIALKPVSQGKGLCRHLMEFAEHYGKQKQCSHIILYTNQAMTENQTLYPHFGFKESHRIYENGYNRIYYIKEI